MRQAFRFAAAGLALSCATVDVRAGADEARIPVIPRAAFFGNPDRTQPRLSPDGKWLSFIAPSDGVLNVWVGPADQPDAAKPVTSDHSRGIRQHFWAFNSSHVVYLQDKGGDENWRVNSVEITTGKTTDLSPQEGVAARINNTSDRFPDEVLIGLNDRNPQLHDLYRVNVRSGERTRVFQNDGYSAILCDASFRPRLVTRMLPDGGAEVLSIAPDGSVSPWDKIGMEDTLTTASVLFDDTGANLYSMDSRGRDTSALVVEDFESRQKRVIAEDPKADADADALLIHPGDNRIQAVGFTYDRLRWKVIDPDVAADLAYLKTVADGDLTVPSRTLDDRWWIVAYLMDNGPVRYYRYDRDHKKAQFLFTNRRTLEGLPLAHMHPVVIPARDGLDLVSYYTLPVWADSDNDGKPSQLLPMVLLVHGGPWARDDWGYHPYHQWLANRGYAVLSVNYRGSTGLGKAFINAGNNEWSGKMHDDLLDAVQWAVTNHIADPARVGIMGGSYGGYATLVGLTFTPDQFACGVAIVGPSNLVTLLNSIPPYWQPMLELFKKRVGDPTTPEGRADLGRRSPLSRVDQIKRPLLIGQGANDPRVKQAESDQIVAAMKQRRIEVTYVLFPDEGHGFARPQNSMAFNAVAEAFLAEHLGGRYQPVDADFKGSSITVPAGAEQVPGVAGALPEGR